MAAMLFGVAAHAGCVDFTWTPPTKNDDNTNLTDGTGYRLFVATTAAGLAGATPTAIPGISTTTYRYCGALGNYFAAISTTSTQAPSGGKQSNSLAFAIPATFGNPPTGLSATAVTVAGIVYKQSIIVGDYSLKRVGTIQAGVQCDPKHRVDGLALFNRDDPAIKYDAAYATKAVPLPLYVLAACTDAS